ncbi:MAG TPA: bifunctional 3,4-dihydroxy-2-butanone-4-phosphate synthase/GTP cyclohydrolase II [Burkholderiaceae bacterium]
MPIASIPEIVEDFKAGRMVILVDEEDRENEGDLVLAADFVTPQAINFMARHARGLICLTLTRERCQRLNLPMMTARNGTRTGTAFTVSIEAAEGVTTGISAADRARTVQVAVARDATARDIVQPGHIFPIMAQDGGVLMRAGHTEAGCDLGAMAGLTPAAVICEIMKDDGTMARLPDLEMFAREHGLKIGTIADLIHHRSANESLIERVASREVSTMHGPFTLHAYRDTPSGSPHLALVRGQVDAKAETLVRVHEPLTILDMIEVDRSTHTWSVNRSLELVAERGSGVIVLLNCAQNAEVQLAQFDALARAERAERAERARGQPDRAGKIDLRTYGIGAQILKDLGVGRMRLLAQPRKMPSMTGFDLEVVGFEPGEQGH